MPARTKIMQDKFLSITKRIRTTPFTRRVEAAGVKAYTVYNHMLLPVLFDTPANDYWHLCEHVQVWDVSCQRQVEIVGPDANRLVQLMTPRDLRKTALLQGKYAPMCDAEGHILNDPIVIKRAENRWWISIADSDIKLWASGLAQGYGFDVKVFEPDVFPLAVQGPKAEELVARVFGDEARSIGFFHGKLLPFSGVDIYVARSGWSKRGGFEIYLHDTSLAEPLWDELFASGADLSVGPGSPNGIERIEAGLLSYGTDMDESHTPFECGLDSFLNLDADINSLSLPALRAMAGHHKYKLVGVIFDQKADLNSAKNAAGGFDVYDGDRLIGEIKSQVWSLRYQKHLSIVMLETAYLESHTDLVLAGQQGQIHEIPFSKAALEA
ncbi:MAG: dimethylsulfoniopropionate demethylase [Gammaproteobacteria bacterium]|nr:dimethylsulfoniopropionate demethylase [Gammaproteobacteria bacterium]